MKLLMNPFVNRNLKDGTNFQFCNHGNRLLRPDWYPLTVLLGSHPSREGGAHSTRSDGIINFSRANGSLPADCRRLCQWSSESAVAGGSYYPTSPRLGHRRLFDTWLQSGADPPCLILSILCTTCGLSVLCSNPRRKVDCESVWISPP